MDKILKIKIELEGIEPLIWRRVEVSPAMNFFVFHHIIQTVMGWTDAHAHEFQIKDVQLGNPEDWEEEPKDFVDSRNMVLEDLIKEGSKFSYNYDLKDGWKHKIIVEEAINREPKGIYPKCTHGERACPPDDCGGVPGYYYLLEVLKDEYHPDYSEMMEWLNEDFDPEEFNRNTANSYLAALFNYN